jgi:hypothetical protein
MSKDIVAQTNAIVMPAVSPDEALKAWDNYLDLKKKIVEPSDIQKIQGKDFLKKSYWRKIATFFNLSVDVVEEKKESLGKTFVWHFTCKATAPNGRYAIGTGSCDAFEKAKKVDDQYMTYNKFNKKWEEATPNSIHNIRSTAETRAFNRAVSNLVGGGEVSADEMVVIEEAEEVKQEPKQEKKQFSGLASEAQHKLIFSLMAKEGLSGIEAKEAVKTRFNLDSFNNLQKNQASEFIDMLLKNQDKEQPQTTRVGGK